MKKECSYLIENFLFFWGKFTEVTEIGPSHGSGIECGDSAVSGVVLA